MAGFISIDKLLIQIETQVKGIDNIKKIDKSIDEINKKTEKSIMNVDKSMRKVQGALLGVGLSFLFTGMSIQRFFQNMLMQLLQNFMLIEGESGYVNDRINELLASLAFIGFQLFDLAVQTGIFDEWVNKIQSLIDWFGNLSEDSQKFILNFSASALIVGAVMSFVGQAMLGVLGIITLIGAIGAPVFLAMIIFAFAIYGIWTVINTEGNNAIKVLKIASIVFGVLLVIVGLLGLALTLPLLVGIFLFGVIIGTILILADHLGGLKYGFLALGIFVLAVLAAIGDAIIESLIAPIRLLIVYINRLIDAYNWLTKSSVSHIQQPEFASLSRGVWEMRNNLIAEAEASKGQTTVNNNVTVNGDITGEGTLEKLKQQISDWYNFSNGSPQAGGI